MIDRPKQTTNPPNESYQISRDRPESEMKSRERRAFDLYSKTCPPRSCSIACSLEKVGARTESRKYQVSNVFPTVFDFSVLCALDRETFPSRRRLTKLPDSSRSCQMDPPVARCPL